MKLQRYVVEDGGPMLPHEDGDYVLLADVMQHVKNLADTGGGCSICNETPAVNVEGTYWLCGSCVNERIDCRFLRCPRKSA